MALRERRFIKQLAKTVKRHARVPLGIGDDAAVIDVGNGFQAVVTTDLMVEGVHFLAHFDSPSDCGFRAIQRCASDLAAMGAEPVAVFLSVALSRTTDAAWLRDFYRGVQRACGEIGAELAGGDLSRSDGRFVADVIAIGRVPRGSWLARDGARPGDRIYVSGIPGLAARGRAIVHRAERMTAADRAAVRRHRRPRARLRLGSQLRQYKLASAAIDISDGLAIDLDRLRVASGVGAVLVRENIPLGIGPAALELALHGGDDYELLFTVPRKLATAVAKLETRELPVTDIGEIVSRRGLWLRDERGTVSRLRPLGWEYEIATGEDDLPTRARRAKPARRLAR